MKRNCAKKFILPVPHKLIFESPHILVEFDDIPGQHVLISEKTAGDSDDLLVMYGYYLGNEFARHRMVEVVRQQIIGRER